MDGASTIIVIAMVFLGFSLIALALRLFVRLEMLKAFGLDDALMVIATVFDIGISVSIFYGAYHGFGNEVGDPLRGAEDMRLGLLSSFICQLMYLITCSLARASIAVTLLRISIIRHHVFILYSATAISTAIGVSLFFIVVFQCRPIDYFWNRVIGQNGSTIDPNIVVGNLYLYSTLAVVCDLKLGILPVFITRKLQMSWRTKAAVSLILGSSCLASAAVIVRFPFLKGVTDPYNSHSSAQIPIWSIIEANLGITTSSLAMTRPLFRKLFTPQTSYAHTYPNSFTMLNRNRAEDLESRIDSSDL